MGTNREKAERFLARTPLSALVVAPSGEIILANDGMSDILGYPLDEMVGHSALDFVHPDDVARAGVNLADAASRDLPAPLRMAARVRSASGEYLQVEIVGANLLDVEGFDGVLVSLRHSSKVGEQAARRGWFEAVLAQASDLVQILDEDGRFLWVNGPVEELVGLPSEALVGLTLLQVTNPEDQDDLARWWRLVLRTPGTGPPNLGARRQPDGGIRHLEVRANNLLHDREVGAVVLTIQDVSERVAAEQAREDLVVERDAHARRARALADLGQRALSGASLGDVIEDACGLAAAAMDLAHVHVQLLDEHHDRLELAAAVGAGADELPAVEPVAARPWLAGLTEHRRPVAVDNFDRAADLTGGPPAAFAQLGLVSGVLCTIDGRGSPIGWLNALDSRERRYDESEVGFLQSIANVLATTVEQSRATEEMARRALHDELTDLPNRALLLDRLTQAMSRLERHAGLIGLLFIDVDRFKRVNDSLGHQAGDRLLVTTAQRLRAAVRAGDTVARTGGDEFLVLTEEVEQVDEVLALADRVAVALGEPIDIDGHQVHVTASIGVAATTSPVDPETLVRDADLAMYRAKQEGRDRIQVFDGTMRREAFTGMAMEEALRSIGASDGLRVAYQPQVDLVTGHIVAMEALARWDHPELGSVPPAEFVAVADDIGVLDEITEVVLREACHKAADLRQAIPALRVAVNLTPRQLSRRRVVAMVDEALAAASLEPAALIVEVTESAALDDGATKRVLADLRARGVRVAIDDFGTGYSSLSRVTHLPVDEVKIDRTFIGGLTEELGRAAAVSAIVTLSRVLGLRLVAEGVEDDAQRQALLDLGCREGQGWLFAGALGTDEIGPWALARAPRDG